MRPSALCNNLCGSLLSVALLLTACAAPGGGRKAGVGEGGARRALGTLPRHAGALPWGAGGVYYSRQHIRVQRNGSETQQPSSSSSTGSAGGSKAQAQVAFGTPAVGREFPYIAQLFYRDGGEIYNFCGATLIAPMVLLTAAHCIKDESGGPDTVVSEVWIGVTNLNTDPPWAYEVRGVQRVIVHPEAVIGRFDIRNDVALVILDRPSSKQTVRLAPYNPTPDPFPGLEVVVAGWGATPAEPDGTYQLQKATVHVLGKAQCIEWIDRQVPDGHMCAWDLKKDPCQGDSGGPLVTHHPANPRADVQVGIVSSGPEAPCGTQAYRVWDLGPLYLQPASVGVYTSVSYYWPWIHQAMAPWAGIRAVSSPPPPPARYLPKPGLVQRPPPRYAAAAG